MSNEQTKITFFINNAKKETETPDLSVRDIIGIYAELDPDKHKLKGKENGQDVEYADHDRILTIKNGDHFTTFFKGAVKVA